MDKNYIRCGIYILIIFISIVIIGNLSVFIYSDSRPNSMDFEELESEKILEEISIENMIELQLKDVLTKMTKFNYDDCYNILSNNNKQEFNNDIEQFKKVISEQYINELSIINVQYAGYDSNRNVYLYDVYLMGPPDVSKLTEEEKKLYTEKLFFIDVYLDENNNYTIELDF